MILDLSDKAWGLPSALVSISCLKKAGISSEAFSSPRTYSRLGGCVDAALGTLEAIAILSSEVLRTQCITGPG